MKFICLVLMLVGIPITSFARDVVDVSSPSNPLISPAIVVRETTVEPDCHTYTGCSVVVLKKATHHYAKPKAYKAKRSKPKLHCVCCRPC